MKININKKTIGIIVIIIIAVVAVAYMTGYIGRPVYGSEREASEAVTDVSSSIEQIESIIEDIDRRLG